MKHIEEKMAVCDGQCKNCQENCTKMNSHECGNCDYMDIDRNYCNYFNRDRSPSADACDHWK